MWNIVNLAELQVITLGVYMHVCRAAVVEFRLRYGQLRLQFGYSEVISCLC